MATPNESWHLSKSVPISLIFALIIQAAAIVWTVSNMSSTIDRNAIEIVRLDARTSSLEKIVQEQAVAMARIDENIKAIRQYVEQMIKQQQVQQ
jgi:aminoglycoside phosphotransferase family enzyme